MPQFQLAPLAPRAAVLGKKFIREWRACINEVLAAALIYAAICGAVVLWSSFQPFEPELPDWAVATTPEAHSLDGVWEGVWGGGEGDVTSAYGRSQRTVIALRGVSAGTYRMFYAVGATAAKAGVPRDLVGGDGALSFEDIARAMPSDPSAASIDQDGSRVAVAASSDGAFAVAALYGPRGRSTMLLHPRGVDSPGGLQRLGWDLPQRFPVVLANLLPFAFGYVLSSLRLYLLITAGFVLVLWLWRPRWVRNRQIQLRRPTMRTLQREVVQNLVSLLVTGLFASFLLGFTQMGWSKVYASVAAWGVPYLVVSFAFAFIVHDAWFYWMHRAYHTRLLYRWVHKFHHLSLTPNPITTLSLSSSEALLGALFLPAYICLVPMQADALMLWIYVSFTRQVMGHIGHELFPKNLTSSPFRFLITVTHHDMHHEHFIYNYGLYFTWWDTVMGTNHPHYVSRYKQVVSRSADDFANGPSKAATPASGRSAIGMPSE